MFFPGKLLSSLRIWSGALLLVTAAVHAQASAQASPVSVHLLEGFGRGTIPLDGAWQFHLVDDPGGAAPAFDDTNWEQLTADKRWGLQGHPAVTGFGWYRFHIAVKAQPGAPRDLVLLIPRVSDAYEVYWNGRLVGSEGRFPPHARWYVSNQQRPANVFPLGNATAGVLAVRVWKAPLFSYDDASAGGFQGLPVAGDATDIANLRGALDYRWLSRNQFRFAESLLYVIVVLVGLFLWARNPRETLPLWMAGFALEVPASAMLTLARIPISGVATVALQQPMFAIEDLCLWLLLLRLLHLSENRRLDRFVEVAAWVSFIEGILDGVLTVLPYKGWVVASDWFLTALVSLLEFLPVMLVIWAVAARKRLSVSRWVLAAAAFLAGGINDVSIVVEQGRQWTQWSFYDKLNAPMFVLGGSAITPLAFAEALLIFAIVYAVYDYTAEERRRRDKLAQEIRNAQELQQVLIPEALPELPGFALTSAYRPAQEVGGDFFQVIPMGSGGTMILLGDVSGKGLRAAMVVSMAVGAVRAIAKETSEPAEILTRLNSELTGNLKSGFVTCLCARFDIDGTVTLANAGHLPPWVNGKEFAMPGALPLGMLADQRYESQSFQMNDGEGIMVMSDGVVEARNEKDGQLYGFARLATLLSANPSAQQVAEEAMKFGQEDDISVLSITRIGPMKAVHA